ncbi:D-alanyl-D-alanine carboxypeptidase family protein [Demequina sp. TTPB684]|uniref:D-alanyl-D-alanine carboxypeptidase family protein n=1 Tax=unclassified Demequina TaxID=2620311 RepID=UPI001CF41D58|nr:MULTISPECIES: D-alanyl-D-alanine carboxypeptidase family protein [unclassified Demequina]MCB2412462.1 D-alanyl-D-alanine carboxypeptidase family protein [Demequina sp. TTPB684]UPU87704.1 D-alanyl-D-alanine carboxypeptidase family protein [Demequina sp. TMPB413]
MILTTLGGTTFALDAPAAAALERAFDDGCPRTHITETHRPYVEQVRIFLERYTVQWFGNGPYGDVRWWKGKRYVRTSNRGMAAIPGTSIHGNGRAIDCNDPMRSWLAAHPEYGWRQTISSEDWHFEFDARQYRPKGVLGALNPTGQEVKVKHYHTQDATARNTGRMVEPGETFHLNTASGLGTDKASNIVGGIGPYVITLHIYAEGEPGDVLEVVLLWDDTTTSGPHSNHYVERMDFDRDGRINRSVTFQHGVARGDAVYARLTAAPGNTAPGVKVTVFDSDAYLFVAA